MLKPYFQREGEVVRTSVLNCVETNLTMEPGLDSVDFVSSCAEPDTGFKLDHLPAKQRTELSDLLNSFDDVFNDKPGKTKVCYHNIELQPGTKPVKLPPYRIHPEKSQMIQTEIDYMLKQGIIEESSSPWAAPIVIIPKPGGSIRFCTDFRRLNNLTVPDAYPMPRIDDLIDKVGGAKYLTKIDLSRGYWQVPMDEASIPISAFVTPQGQFQWRYMPFGLRNAPATFQRLINKVLSGCGLFTAAYLDDILIFSSSWEDHLSHVSKVLERLRSAGLTIKKSKCVFANAEVEFLGHKIGLRSVEPRREKVQALLDFPRPANRKQLRSYLGLAGYYRKFIPHFAQITVCLNQLLRKGARFEWTSETETAFLDLKSRLASRPILRTPDFQLPFCLAVDASDIAIGANLFQVIDGVEHPLCYYSKRLDVHQRHYSTVEKEALALLTATRVFSVYFGSQSVTVYTDHSPLQFINKMANSNQKLLRWSLELQQYNLKIVHRAGKNNLIPDILSRPAV
jgi:hypothetical protein